VEILYAPNNTEIKNRKVIFLAGPIRCAINWQELFLQKCRDNDMNFNNFIIANPRREAGQVPTKDFDYMMFEEQIKWEVDYLSEASKNGYVTCFLANQLISDPFQSYARTTRFEIGEWFGELKNRDDVNIIIGYDKQFPGLKYVLKRIQLLIEKNPQKANQITVCKPGLDSYMQTLIDKMAY
jgi:hypothetical protein